jgi:DNA (cytosine-5)-methyltransferase 1
MMRRIQKMSNSQLTAVSLFTGAGGMDVGFERAGIKVVFANELMKEAAQTYRANHPNSVMVNDDINNIMDSLIQYEGTDLVFGGPPCQGFSVAGKMDPDDDRSKLIFTFLDVVEKVKPRAFVMENVKALGILEKWEPVRKKYLDRARTLGYYCVPFILNATEFNVSQKRERVFFIGIKNGNDPFFEYNMMNILEEHKKKAPTVRELLYSLGRAGTESNPNTCTAKITFATHPVMRKSPYAGMYFNGQGRPINIDDYANTLPAAMGGNKTPFVDEEYLYGDATEDWVVAYHKGLMDGTITPEFEEAPARLRRITVNEAIRIQTFPDDYVFCGNKGRIYTQIGNAVPCNMAEAVARSVIRYLDEI